MIVGNYLAAVALFCIGLYAVLTKRNLVKIVMGLSLVEASKRWQATDCEPCRIGSGRSTRQRSKTKLQRGLNEQPGGIADSRGIEPGICTRRSTSASSFGIEPIRPLV